MPLSRRRIRRRCDCPIRRSQAGCHISPLYRATRHKIGFYTISWLHCLASSCSWTRIGTRLKRMPSGSRRRSSISTSRLGSKQSTVWMPFSVPCLGTASRTSTVLSWPRSLLQTSSPKHHQNRLQWIALSAPDEASNGVPPTVSISLGPLWPFT